jgi:predicted porin
MKQKMIVLAIGAALAASAAQADVDLMGKEVQIYGKLHVSADSYDIGGTGPNATGAEIVSNSSRLGFKGQKDLGGVNGVWKIETTVDITGDSTDFTARNRYAGLSGSWGQLTLGINDTPFKEMLGYTLFGDTVGDSRNILGVTSNQKKLFNVRASSMIRYDLKAGGFSGSLEYSPDANKTAAPDTNNDNNAVTSLRLGYKAGGLDIAAAYEKQDNMGNVNNANANGYRVGVKYKIADLTIGGVYEGLTDDGYGAVVERNAYGLNLAYKISGFTLAGQYLVADTSGVGSDGASNMTAGVYYDLFKGAQIYGVYSSLKNDAAASYVMGIDGHGQKYAPSAAGETVTALSAGMVYSF